MLSSRRLTRVHRLILFTAEGKIKVRGHVAWSNRIGFRRHEVGFEFENLDDETAAMLAVAATAHAFIRAA